MRKFDLIIIGAGSGGVRTARKAALLGKKIAVIEANNVGGTCVNLGCIPKKIMMYSSKISRELKNSSFLGWDIDGYKFNWQEMVKYRDQEITRIRSLYNQTLNKYENITLIQGYAKFVNNNTIEVNDEKLLADKILIATGSRPQIPNIQGRELFITSDQLFCLPSLPKSIIIIGSGYISMEFASIMNGFGSKVTVINRGDKFLKVFDQDSVNIVINELEKGGVKFILNNNISSLEKDNNSIICNLENGQKLNADVVLCAIGRNANTDKLDLQNTNVDLDELGEILVDEFTCSSSENIHAVGDVTGNIGLAPIAIKEAHAFIDNVYYGIKTSTEYNNVPMSVFTCPSLARVGYTEEEAIKRFGSDKIRIVKKEFLPLIERFRSEGEKNFIKFVIENSSDKIIGMHMVGDLAPELIQLAAICIQAGLTKKQFSESIPLHPTVAEELVLMPNE